MVLARPMRLWPASTSRAMSVSLIGEEVREYERSCSLYANCNYAHMCECACICMCVYVDIRWRVWVAATNATSLLCCAAAADFFLQSLIPFFICLALQLWCWELHKPNEASEL